MDSYLVHFWGDWSQSEKLFEIKPPLIKDISGHVLYFFMHALQFAPWEK